MRKWLPLIILAPAQFIMVLDSSVMNVSISPDRGDHLVDRKRLDVRRPLHLHAGRDNAFLNPG